MSDIKNKKRARPVEVAALPSNEEQKQLANIDTLLRSNLLDLQVNELLESIDGSSKMSKKPLLDWIDDLKSHLTDASSRSMVDREITSTWASKLPLTGLELTNSDISITFACPEVIVAPWQVIKPLYTLEVLLVMPACMFTAKDLLGGAYMDKKRLFLAAVYKTLMLGSKDAYKDAAVVFADGDARCPVLQLHPAFSADYTVRLVPIVAEDTFKAMSLRGEKNNVRPADWALRCAADPDGSTLPGTPDYNNLILSDMTRTIQMQVYSRVMSNGAGYGYDGVLRLFLLWATQHDFLFAAQGLDTVAVHMLVAYLVIIGKLPSRASGGLAGFMSLMGFLSHSDFATHVMDMSSSSAHLVPRNPAHGSNSVVLIHPIGSAPLTYNVLWRMSSAFLRVLQTAARRTLAALKQRNTFDEVFMAKTPFARRNDVIVHVPLHRWEGGLLRCCDGPEALHMSEAHYLARRVEEVLARGLSDRVGPLELSVCFASAQSQSAYQIRDQAHPLAWSRKRDSAQAIGYLAVGMALDTANALRKVDKGPAVGEGAEAVDAFLAFYGDKASMRRFKNGDIIYAVVWERGAVDEIASYLLQRHCGGSGSSNGVRVINGQLEDLCHLLRGARCMPEIDSLRALLHRLPLPLGFDRIYCTSSSSTSSSSSSSSAHPLLGKFTVQALAGSYVPLVCTPLEVHAVYSSSNRWPSTPEGVAACLLAMRLQLIALLQAQGVHAFVQEGQADRCLYLVHEGVLYRLHTHTTEEAPGPAHGNNIRSIAHPLYQKVLSAALLWRDLHYLTNHLGDRVVELLVAREFLVGAAPPTTVQSGLMRVLSTLAAFNWEDEPFMVNFHPSTPAAMDETAIHFHFRAMRDAAARVTDPLIAREFPSMFVVSNTDALDSLEHYVVPEKVVLRLLLSCAKASLKKLQKYCDPFAREGDGSDEALLRSLASEAILSKCDLLLPFHPALLPVPGPKGSQIPPQATHVEVFANTPAKDLALDKLMLADPRNEVIKDLQGFDQECVFFHNACNGRAIGVLFRPSFTQSAPLDVTAKWRKLLDGGEGKQQAAGNRDELLQAMLGRAKGLLLSPVAATAAV